MGNDEVDPVDAIIDQWRRERPDLAAGLPAMGAIGRATRWHAAVLASFDELSATLGLTTGEVDVLFALRRDGEPFTLTPSALARTLMLSPAGMTSRIDKLERAGLVTRTLDPDDRRSFRIDLTPDGRRVADDAIAKHVENERRIVSPLTEAELRRFDAMLRKLLGGRTTR